MYARLWWKDTRQFWPIWVFLALAAAVVQGLLLHYLEQDARHGALGVSALICASLYAFATGAAAFAGERETGTLRLLDVLPIDRRVVWMGKVSFALVTTLSLMLVLLAMAAVSTDQWKPQGPLSIAEALCFGMMVLVALGWGLVWSAILSNALTAAVLAICCTGVSLSFLLSGLDNVFLNPIGLLIFTLWHFLVFLVTLIASVVIFARAMRWKRLQLEFRSPIVVNLTDSTSSRRRQIQIQSPVATVLLPRPAAGLLEALATDQPPHRSWMTKARALAWQTMREGRRTWYLLVVIGLVLPGLMILILKPAVATLPEWDLLISVGVTLVAGASVFGLENRTRTQRFLTHHGAQPGLVWMMKLAVWGVGLAAIWGPLILMAKLTMANVGPSRRELWYYMVLIVPLFFGVSQLCGMAIRRGITTVVIALVIALVMLIPLGALIDSDMLPVQGLLVIPVGLLVVSWAWSGDWLLDRPAPGRWVRLGLLLTGMFGLVVSWYASYRAWSIRDVGAIAPPTAWAEAASSPLPADQNAADLYSEAGARLIGPLEDSPEFLDRNRELLDLLRRAAARPHCRFPQPEKLTVLDRPGLPPVSQFANLLALDASERQNHQNHSDLAGAWDDVVALFHIARHVSEGTGLNSAFLTLVSVERTALGVALEWAIAHGQTPERLHKALAAYRELPKMPAVADIVRVEANLVENTLDLPTSRLRDWALESDNGHTRPPSAFASIVFDLATMPWERVRARRVNHLIAKLAIQDAALEPWQRSRVRDSEIEDAQQSSRSAMLLIPNLGGYIEINDRNEVARRALVQVLALREWQLKHGGEFPKNLDALVPEELPSLPNDPYSGRPFGYVHSSGQEVPPLHSALSAAPGTRIRVGEQGWLLYSVGPDGRDDGGITFKEKDHRPQPMDIVFEIPPMEGDGGASKKGQDTAKDQPVTTGRPSPASPGP
jgi:ABC-2 family transporter protein